MNLDVWKRELARLAQGNQGKKRKARKKLLIGLIGRQRHRLEAGRRKAAERGTALAESEPV